MTAARNFSPISAPALSNEARKAVNAAFDAVSSWRTVIVNNSEKVIGQMAEAARLLGWPAQIVDATRAQMQNITKMQIQAMDQIIDAWEEQIKSPASPSAMLSKLESLPGFGPARSWPSPDGSIEPFRGLHAVRRTVSESLGRRDGILDQGGQISLFVIDV